MLRSISSKARWLFAIAVTLLAGIIGTVVGFRSRRADDEAKPVQELAEEHRRTAGELAKAQEREARALAQEKRQQQMAEAQRKADRDARITNLRDYVLSRKR